MAPEHVLEAKEPAVPRLVLTLSALGTLGAGAVWGFVASEQPGARWSAALAAALAIGIAGTLAWRLTRLERFRIRLDAAGLHDFRLGLSIPWDEVSSAELRQEGTRFARFSLLLLKLRDPARHADRVSGLLRRFAKQRGADVCIDLTNLKLDPQAVKRYLNAKGLAGDPTAPVARHAA